MAALRRTWAYPLAALGAVGLASSLWLPWYSFTVPDRIISGAEQLSGQAGVLGPLLRQGAEELRNLGPVHVKAWDVLHQIPIVLVLAAGAGGALALLAATGRARGAGRAIAWAGGIALAFAAFRALWPPDFHGLLHTAWGAWLAVASAAAVLVGGLLGGKGEEAAEEWSVAAPSQLRTAATPSWSTASSVPPPGQ